MKSINPKSFHFIHTILFLFTSMLSITISSIAWFGLTIMESKNPTDTNKNIIATPTNRYFSLDTHVSHFYPQIKLFIFPLNIISTLRIHLATRGCVKESLVTCRNTIPHWSCTYFIVENPDHALQVTLFYFYGDYSQ